MFAPSNPCMINKPARVAETKTTIHGNLISRARDIMTFIIFASLPLGTESDSCVRRPRRRQRPQGVPGVGFEPTRACSAQGGLSPSRLPIPPPGPGSLTVLCGSIARDAPQTRTERCSGYVEEANGEAVECVALGDDGLFDPQHAHHGVSHHRPGANHRSAFWVE